MALPHIVSLILLAASQASATFKINKVAYAHVDKGPILHLLCRANDHYQSCTWIHNTGECNFEWRKSGGVRKTNCTLPRSTRVNFSGNYNNHECDIDIHRASTDDFGNWTCLVHGYYRKAGVRTQSVVVSAVHGEHWCPPGATAGIGHTNIIIILGCFNGTFMLIIGFLVFKLYKKSIEERLHGLAGLLAARNSKYFSKRRSDRETRGSEAAEENPYDENYYLDGPKGEESPKDKYTYYTEKVGSEKYADGKK